MKNVKFPVYDQEKCSFITCVVSLKGLGMFYSLEMSESCWSRREKEKNLCTHVCIYFLFVLPVSAVGMYLNTPMQSASTTDAASNVPTIRLLWQQALVKRSLGFKQKMVCPVSGLHQREDR